jgi:hypothetical protein
VTSRYAAFRWMRAALGAFLVLAASSSCVQAIYPESVPSNSLPLQSGPMLGEFSTFVSDFSQWNASHNDLPLWMLELTPAAERGETFLWLFWMWLQNQGTGGLFPSSVGPMDLSIGSINLGEIGGAPAFPFPNGGNEPPGLGDSSGVGTLPSGPPSPIGNSNGQGPGSDLLPAGPLDSGLPAVSAPEPATFTLLATGIIGLLLTYRIVAAQYPFRWLRDRLSPKTVGD